MEIKYNDVTHIYNEKTNMQTIALDHINLSINENKITGIIGASASGKTTLIELLSALIIPSKGYLKVDDFIIKKNKRIKKINNLRKKVGIIFQFPEEQFFNSTVKEEIGFALKAFNYSKDKYDKRISDSLKMVNLTDEYLNKNPFDLSYGEQRQIAIASVLVYNPKIIVFDEPNIGLDGINKEKLIKLIRLLKNKYHKTIIIVSHDLDLINIISDDVIVLSNGKVVLNGNKNEIFKHDLSIYNIKKTEAMEFIDLINKEKKIKIPYRNDINDILKDILRNVK